MKENLRQFREEHQKIQGTVSHKTSLIQEWPRTTSPRFLKKLKGESVKKFPKVSAGRSHAFWALRLNLMSCFWTHKFGFVPRLFREHPGTAAQKTGKPLGSFPRRPLSQSVFSACHPSNLNDSEQDETHHNSWARGFLGRNPNFLGFLVGLRGSWIF